MVVDLQAKEQYGDMRGTIELDHADFERYSDILGIDPEWLVLGFRLFTTHPSLGAQGMRGAESSHTMLTVWAMPWADLPEAGGLPALFENNTPVAITEFSFDTPDNEYPDPRDAVSTVLRGAKRFTLVAWDRAVVQARLSESDFTVVNEIAMQWGTKGWVEYDPYG